MLHFSYIYSTYFYIHTYTFIKIHTYDILYIVIRKNNRKESVKKH